MNTEKLKQAIDDIENAGQNASLINALAFTTWDSFENGSFEREIDDYAPLLRLMYEQATALKAKIENIAVSLRGALKEGGSA